MIIAISGKAGSGKSTVARMLSKKLGLKHYSIGDLMREMASEKGMSLLELNKQAEKEKSIDLELDNRLKELGKTKDNFVIDGRLTAFFIPNAEVRIFLNADSNIRAERILNDKRKQEKTIDVKETMINIKRREESEKKRYRNYYGADYMDKKLYNYTADTTSLTADKVVEGIIKFIESRKIKEREL